MLTLKKAGGMLMVSALIFIAIATTASAQKADSFAAARQKMIEHDLKGRGISDEAVLQAMREVPRERFVGPALQAHAYADYPLPIGHAQTISQPYVVAFMTQMLKVRPEDKILEIGTGCGYQAAVLARLARQVYTVEIVEPLADGARKLLAELGYQNISVKAGDGFDGWRAHAPFDRIILTCAVQEIPPALIEQLQEGGRIIAPMGDTDSTQQLVIATKQAGKLKHSQVLPVRFVPMTGKALEAAK